MFRPSILAVAAIAAIAPVASHAATRVPFERAAFEAAQKAGKPVLVEVSAVWCPVCASQSRSIEAAMKDPRNRALTVFRLDFDKQKAEWQRFGVKRQGTLIAFKGQRESGRLEFVTDKAAIEGLIGKIAA